MTENRWSLRFGGIILLSGTILLFIVTGAYYGLGWPYQDARIGTGIVAAIATIALALGIYLQSSQNQSIIKQNETQIMNNQKQSLILQESQWMPIGTFKNEGLQFRFNENRPYNPRLRFVSDDSDTGWIDLEVGDQDRATGHWVVGIGGILEENLEIDRSSYDGVLKLRFESTTGVLYEYEYGVSIDEDADNSKRIKVNSETRKLPWRDEIE